MWDEQIYRLLGYEPFSIPASYQAFVNSLHPEDRPTILDADARALGKVITQEYRVVWPDGIVRWIEGRKLPYHYGVMRDITDRKAREAYILKAERLEAAGQLLSGLAHDFNNFLATISASLESVGNAISDPQIARRLLDARQAAMAGAHFSRRLINISKQREWRPQILPAGEQITRLASTILPLMRKEITLTTECPLDLWLIKVDPLEFDSALINIIINARDAILSTGSIKVTAANHSVSSDAAAISATGGEYVVITVRDTGEGMDDYTLSRATEPFFTTKPEGVGTGLGLSSVAAFAAAAGGFVSIRSELGLGTSVSIHLPREHGVLDAAPSTVSDVPRGEGKLVLVVDDDGLSARSPCSAWRLSAMR